MDVQQLTRTREVAIAEVRFGIEFGSLNERFWHRFDTLLNFIQIFSGAFALTGAIVQGTLLAGAAGAVLALISAVQLTVQPTRRAFDFRDARVKFHDLNARAPTMSLGEIDTELERLRGVVPQGLSALEMPALNRVDARHGYPPARELRFGERVALFVA